MRGKRVVASKRVFRSGVLRGPLPRLPYSAAYIETSLHDEGKALCNLQSAVTGGGGLKDGNDLVEHLTCPEDRSPGDVHQSRLYCNDTSRSHTQVALLCFGFCFTSFCSCSRSCSLFSFFFRHLLLFLDGPCFNFLCKTLALNSQLFEFVLLLDLHEEGSNHLSRIALRSGRKVQDVSHHKIVPRGLFHFPGFPIHLETQHVQQHPVSRVFTEHVAVHSQPRFNILNISYLGEILQLIFILQDLLQFYFSLLVLCHRCQHFGFRLLLLFLFFIPTVDYRPL
mmetsp:Transcript_24004/g.41392  ORF Transcript_24004/g.41392 Transcript_24004/m.41392 type:complete len:281 (+) Transcript_24004:703-1545(+)